MSNKNITMTQADIHAINQHLEQNSKSIKKFQRRDEREKTIHKSLDNEKNKRNTSESKGKIIITHQNQKQPQLADENLVYEYKQKNSNQTYYKNKNYDSRDFPTTKSSQIAHPQFQGSRLPPNQPTTHNNNLPPYNTDYRNSRNYPSHPLHHFQQPPTRQYTDQRIKQYSPNKFQLARHDYLSQNYHLPIQAPNSEQNIMQNAYTNNREALFLHQQHQHYYHNQKYRMNQHQLRKGSQYRPSFPPHTFPPHSFPLHLSHHEKINPLIYQNNSMRGKQQQWQDFLNSNGFESQANLIRRKGNQIQNAQRIFLNNLPDRAVLKRNKNEQDITNKPQSINQNQQLKTINRDQNQISSAPIQQQEELMSKMDDQMKESYNLQKANLQDIAHLLSIKLEKYYRYQFQQFKVKKCECSACRHLVLPFLIKQNSNPEDYLVHHYEYLKNFVSMHFDEESSEQTLKRIFKQKYEEYNQRLIDFKRDKGQLKNNKDGLDEYKEGDGDEEEGEQDKGRKSNIKNKEKSVLQNSYRNIDVQPRANVEDVIQGEMVCNYLMTTTLQ